MIFLIFLILNKILMGLDIDVLLLVFCFAGSLPEGLGEAESWLPTPGGFI